ncbi:autotransporter strand-loop-strand O-heptosyltransferase [Verrucomicrobia bacterium]|jgi:autotransporter strand-loop-strand O-heptosyltransferase|nr:autotransporter strand-loop-strand O-heptosyltransferase [Verrucomicrobiota bacterium]
MKSIIDIVNNSQSLGDCIGWVPMVQKYAKINNTKVNFYTPYKEIFDREKYDFVNFFDWDEKPESEESIIKLFYNTPANFHDASLQEVACRLLNIPYEEERTVLVKKSRPSVFSKKYVCIATQSTLQAKYWNNKSGWKKVVKYLKFLGYHVVCIDKDKSFGIKGHFNEIPNNCIDKTGDISLQNRIDDLYNCEFFIGLGSGLSWLAWACNKPVVMISGFSKSYAEFSTPYRVINENVCNGCWNNPSVEFNFSDWMWCPEGKSFECSRKISFEMVKEKIDTLIKDNNK